MRKATTTDTIEFEVKSSETSSEVKEQKGFNGKEMVLYPSAKTKIRFALIDLGENADWLLNDDKSRDNPNKTVFTVNSLVEPFRGSRKVISGRRLIQKKAEEALVKDGKVVAPKGTIFSFYDKYGKCELTELNKEWEKRGDKNKYRVSGAETYFLSYVFDITNLETNEKKEINQVALIGFNVMDIYSSTSKATGVGQQFEELLLADSDGDIAVQNYSLTYSMGNLQKFKKEMTSKEQALIDELRSKKDELMEDYKHLLPIPYKTLMEAVERGEYQLSYPQASKDGGFGNNMTEEEVIPF